MKRTGKVEAACFRCLFCSSFALTLAVLFGACVVLNAVDNVGESRLSVEELIGASLKSTTFCRGKLALRLRIESSNVSAPLVCKLLAALLRDYVIR